MALSFFGKKKEETTPQTANGAGGAGDKGGGKTVASGSTGGGWEWDSGKADKFFERAATLHEATNFGYAMNMWIRGLRFNPLAMNGLEGYFTSAGKFFSENPKGEKEDTYKSTLKDAGGKTDVDKYLTSLVQWSSHPFDPAYSVKAMQNAAGLGLEGPTVWIAERAFGAITRDKKPRKEHMVAVMEALTKFEKFELALQAGEAAVRIDPNDGNLASEVKNLAAEWTTKKGGFDQTGEEGGFRKNIRDAAKQQQMEDRDRVVSTGEVMDRQVASARADAEASPNDRPNAIRLIDALIKRAKPEDDDEAIKVATAWYEKAKEYKFKEYVDTIRVRALRRKRTSLQLQSNQEGAGDEVKEAYKAASRELIKAEILALQGQVAAYPTDLGRKYRLGEMMFRIGKYEEAISLLQEAKADPANKAKVDYFLGLSFQQIGWNDEAIETLRGAMGNIQAGDTDTEMTLKYGLMEALLARAKSEGGAAALSDAEEALKLASSIAIQNMNYKEVRAKRDEIKALIAKLKSGGAGA